MISLTKQRLFIAVFLAYSYVAAQDYCDPKLCRWSTHIACGHNNEFASTCPSNAVLVTMNPNLRNLLVNTINEKRNFIAGGGYDKLKPACRMATMQWDDELAYLAELNVKQCRMQHDRCHNTNSVPRSGQNLAWMTFSGAANDAIMLRKALQMWYNEVAYSNMKIINSFPRSRGGRAIGHFTVMVSERNNRVGCAASKYSNYGSGYSSYLVACNMAYTNMIGERVYSNCNKSAIGCKSGKNAKFLNLCNISEVYDSNSW